MTVKQSEKNEFMRHTHTPHTPREREGERAHETHREIVRTTHTHIHSYTRTHNTIRKRMRGGEKFVD